MDIGYKSSRTLCDVFDNMRECVKTLKVEKHKEENHGD